MFKRHAVGAAALACLAASVQPAFAQQTLERVEITGSAIRRSITDEGALPITVVKVDDLRQQGVSSVEGILELLSASQSSSPGSNSIGSGTGGASYANLRGLGSNKTLILLNGRRMTSFAFDANAVDLNSIPFAVIDRVEVLRDGASAVYGTDAIGGVINFITKSNFRGGQIVAEMTKPRQDGGKKEGGSVTVGFGDLEKDKFNFWGSFDTRRQQRIRALDRDFAKTGIIPSRGVNGNSGTTFPGNFSGSFIVPVSKDFPTGRETRSYNPTAPNCAPPLSVVNPTNANACVFDFSSTIDIIPDTKQNTIAGRAAIQIAEGHVLTMEGLATENKNIARVAPDPVSGVTINPGNPAYPTGIPNLDTTKPINVGWRMVPAGPRTNESNSTAKRAVIDLSGVVASWDYRLGAMLSRSTGNDAAADGYVSAPFVRAQVAAGNLNPFRAATAAELAIIEQAKRRGVFGYATGETKGVDIRASRDLFSLPGGNAALALSGEFRKENYRFDTNDDVVNNIPSAGRSPNHKGGDRKVTAFGAEMLLPVLKNLEVQVALRTDDYSDAGRSTNPKIGFRFTPIKEVVLRGSYNTGFRAPGLDDLYAPQTVTFSAGAKNDPLLCDANGKAIPSKGGVQSRDCGLQPQVQNGGNANLKPEKSKTFTVGAAFEPIKDLTFSIDYWNIKLRDQINVLPLDTIIADSTRYAANFVRCSTLPIAVQNTLNRCAGLDNNSPAIGYIIQTNDNIGKIKTNGFDLTAGYNMKLGGLGALSLSYDGTYVRSYQYQTNPSDPYKENVGIYSDGSPVFKWKHNLSAAWALDNLGARMSLRHQSGYRDQNDPTTVVGGPSFYGNVESYTLVDLSASYKFNKMSSLTIGVKNLFDKDPPFSNQSTRSQRGYDPRYSDPMGRALFVRAAYGF
ncbi:MAG TPA: TonB-dependent receptor [Roseateles sp.]|uniref:TonB-dependent receptor n=1 Tax=Roseateles sp. TaxID=1971397 RepID=UPI002ED8B66C